jgi:hypothetical protein
MSRRRNPSAGWSRAGVGIWTDQRTRRSNTSHNGRQGQLPLHIVEELQRLFEQVRRIELLLAAWYPQEPPLPLGQVVPLASEQKRWIKREELLELVEQIEKANPPSLGERSKAFLDGLRQLAAEYPKVRLSPKQSAWLDGLVEDAGVPDAPEQGA